MFTLIFTVLCLGAVLAEQPSNFNGPIIQTRGGAVQGVQQSCGLFCRYYAFNGIPFAEPPVGDLRFRGPVPHGGWEGVRDGSQQASDCPTSSPLGGEYSGSEDCLYLNVYSQNLLGRKAVMVWIHGGAFVVGSGNGYGPDHIVQEDVLVVTIHYRLGILGYLSTGDKHAPGNYGVKDAILALQWVKDNILAFGGDPDNITIFGQSAGGSMVHYIVLSPLANGLYAKAIAQSGTALSPWAFQPDPAHWAFHIGEEVGIVTDSSEELVERLRAVSANDLINVSPSWLLGLEVPRGFTSMPLVPSVDAPDSEEPRAIPDYPRNLMARGEFNKIPFMLGYTDAESLFIIHENTLDNTTIDTLNADQYRWIPTEFNVPRGSADADQIIQEIKDFYLNGQDMSVDLRWEWSRYVTDRHFVYGVDETVKAHLQHQDDAIYYYQFSFTGALNLMRNFLLLGSFPGAAHADELAYMWSLTGLPPPLLPTNHAFVIRRRLLRMFTNFAITGNPTSSLSPDVQVQWPRVSTGGEYMDIGHDLVPGQCAMCDRVTLYYSWRDRFGR